MQINEIQINGFGKLKNKNIKLNNGINLIHGKNETGKSTLADFIRIIFYGISKNKNGKAYSDYEKYLPWGSGDFAGKIDYTIYDEKYTLTRDFSKNKSIIYDASGNDINDLFIKTKSKGNNIGFEQLGIDEETFVNSSLIRQNQIAVDSMSQNEVIQKLGNAIQTGDESLSYDEILKKMEKILYDEVGTDRTSTKPKYLLKRDIARLEFNVSSLESNRQRSELIREAKDKLEQEIADEKIELEEFKKISEIDNKYEKEIQEENVKFEIEQKEKNKIKEQKEKIRIICKIVDAVMIAAVFIALIAILASRGLYLFIPLAIILCVAGEVIDYKFSFKEEIDADAGYFDQVLEDIKKKRRKELLNVEKNGIVKNATEMTSLEIKKTIGDIESQINNNILEIHKYKIEEDSLKENLGELNEAIEDLSYKKEEYTKLLEKEEMMDYAICKLREAYEDVKKTIIPKLEADIKYNVSKTTNGKYNNIKYNDNMGIVCENEYGEIIPIDRLSGGTIDQIYLGFRMAVADKYEGLPLIFDETFVNFDDERLTNILKTISDVASDRQVIILTCSKREKDILDNLKVKYNIVEL